MNSFNEDYYNMTCPVCGIKFHLKQYSVKRAKTHYCSRDCFAKAKVQIMSGEKNHQYGLKGMKNASWKHDEKVSNHGYRMLRRIDHPFRGKDDFVFEHRLIAEQYLLNDENSVVIDGIRYLSPDFVVHHKNGDRLDNRPENLEVMTLAKHSSMHNREDPQPRNMFTGKFIPRRFKVVIDDGGYLPERAYDTDAGYDLRTPECFCVPAKGSAVIGTKVHINIPKGYAGFLKSKSGLNVNYGLLSEGVVDANYVGEIKCKLYNHSDADYQFERGDKISQLVILPVPTPTLKVVDELESTERGSNGFGSTGR